MRRWMIVMAVIAALAAAGGGYYYYRQVSTAAQAATETPALQTAAVSRGDLTLSASGVGNLEPAETLTLGFSSSGRLSELNVAVGDKVQAGDVLARLDDTNLQMQLTQAQLNLAAAERSLQTLTSATAVAEAEQAVVAAQAAAETAARALTQAAQPDVAYYQQVVAEAETAVSNAQAEITITDVGDGLATTLNNAKKAVTTAETGLGQAKAAEAGCGGCDPARLQRAQEAYDAAVNHLQAVQLQMNMARQTNAASLQDAQAALVTAKANLAAAQAGPDALMLAQAQADKTVADAKLAQAQAALAELKGAAVPAGAVSVLAGARAQVTEAQLALQTAELNLANAVLTAPFDGTITAVNGLAGQTAGSSLLILAALDEPLVRFYIDEADLGSVAVDYPVEVTFEAAPDVTFTGTVTRVDPALVTVGNSAVVQAWARLEANPTVVKLLAGMNAEVDVIAGQTKNALLVPVQALRVLTADTYAVFVVQADGSLKLTPVTIGLKDFTSAEILTGLAQGETVSTGTTEVSQ